MAETLALPVHIHNQINDSLASLEALENKRIEKFTHAHVCIPQVGKKKKKNTPSFLSRTVPTCPAIRKRRQNTDENYKWTLLSRELALIYERVVKIISEPWLRIRFVNGFICSASCVGMEKRSK